jgi:hypothetical protein
MARPKVETHPLLLHVPIDLFNWLSKEAESKRWSNPTFTIETLRAAKMRTESRRKVETPK